MSGHITKRILLSISIILYFVMCGGVLTRQQVKMRQLPKWVTLSKKLETVQIQQETISVSLKEGVLKLYSEQFDYESDSTWIVADCIFLDVDHDEEMEVLLHVWKQGSFGEYQPFWRKQDNRTLYSEHLFLYEWDKERADRLDPKWMSSAMPVYGKSVSAEANGDILICSPDGSETLWRWEDWGLILIQSQKSDEQ